MSVLRIEGEVDRCCEFSLQDLRRMAGQVEDVSTLVPRREGSAIEFASLLQMAGVKDRATHARLTSSDGTFTASVPLRDVKDALILYRIGNEALPPDQGGPFRFLIPNPKQCHSGSADACANVKHLGSIEILRQ